MIQTPLGRIEITKDEKKVDCTIRRVRNDDRCPELNGRFAVLIDYIPDGQEHTVSCCIKGIRESKSDFIESDERVDIKSFCRETTKLATVYKGNIIKNLIMDCQSYTKYRPNETTGGIFVSWRRKEELPTGA